MNNKFDYKRIFELIRKAILTRNFYLLDQEKIILPSVTQLGNYLKKHVNEFTYEIIEMLDIFSSEFFEQLTMLKEFIENNEYLDSVEKVKEYLSLVPFNGTTSDRNYVIILRLCGININYNQDFSLLISYLLNITVGGDIALYIERIRKYDLRNCSRYRIYSEAEIIEYISTLRLGYNGMTLSYECSQTIPFEILNYMKKNDLPFNPFVIKKLRDTVFKEIVDESVQMNCLPNNFVELINDINDYECTDNLEAIKLKKVK